MLGCILQRQMPVIKVLNTYSSIKMGDMIFQKCEAGMAVGTHCTCACDNWVHSPSGAATIKQAWITFSFPLFNQTSQTELKSLHHCRSCFPNRCSEMTQVCYAKKVLFKEEEEEKSNKYPVISSIYFQYMLCKIWHEIFISHKCAGHLFVH